MKIAHIILTIFSLLLRRVCGGNSELEFVCPPQAWLFVRRTQHSNRNARLSCHPARRLRTTSTGRTVVSKQSPSPLFLVSEPDPNSIPNSTTQATQLCKTGTPGTAYVNGRMAILARYGIPAVVAIINEGGGWINAIALWRNASGSDGNGTAFSWFDTSTQLEWPAAPNVLMNTSLGRVQWSSGHPISTNYYTGFYWDGSLVSMPYPSIGSLLCEFVNWQAPVHYHVVAHNVTPLAAYQIMSTIVTDVTACIDQCAFQVPTCDSFTFTSTTNNCTLSYTRYVESLYTTSPDANMTWWEPVYDV